MTYSRSAPRRATRDLDPDPAEVLGPDVLARADRWKRVYRVSAAFKIDCWRDAELLANRLDFIKFERAHGRGES
jgi:hypothetical protein